MIALHSIDCNDMQAVDETFLWLISVKFYKYDFINMTYFAAPV